MQYLMRIVCLCACVALAACHTTPVSSWVPGYLTNTHGDLLFNEKGQCWRTAEWRPELAIPQCDPLVVAARDAQKSVKTPQIDKKTGQVVVPTATTQTEVRQAATSQPGEIQALSEDKASREVTVTFVPLHLSSDVSFGFDDANLTKGAGKSLEAFIAQLQHSKVDDIHIAVVGYADRIGLKDYNLGLSQRRAHSVKAWLVSRGVSAQVIEATGVGEAYPITRLEDCPDSLSRQALVQCFAPDRRVEVRAQGKLQPEK